MATYDISITNVWTDAGLDPGTVNMQNRHQNKIEYRVQGEEPDAEDPGIELFPACHDTPATHAITIGADEALWVRMLRAPDGKAYKVVAVDAV